MPPQFGTKIDSRDNKTYRTVLMPDGKWWLAEDVVYAGTASPDPGYYTWAEALDAIIPGCRMPRFDPDNGCQDWDDLEEAVGSEADAGYHLKTTTGWTANGIDDFGFGATRNGYYIRNFNEPSPWYFVLQPETGSSYFYEWTTSSVWFRTMFILNNLPATSTTGSLDKVQDQYGGGRRISLRLIVESGNIPDPIIPQIYGTDFDGFERDASVRIERNIRWVDSVGGGVQGIPTMGPSLDTWQISA